MEGRGYSELYRNTSEEMFIKSMMESSVGMPAPTMEMLGFKNLGHNFRTDSEELFKSWLTNGESNGCHSSGMGLFSRQASRRISTEIASFNQNGVAVQKKLNDGLLFPQTAPVAVDSSNNLDSTRNGVEKGLQASNLFLAKAWFHSSQPMTRSRSSELRKRYVAMQNSQTAIGIEAMHQASGTGVDNFKHEPTDAANGLNNILSHENPNHFNAFISPSNSSSSTFNNPQVGDADKISSVVSMLKGTLERKKLCNQVEKEDTSFGYYSGHDCLNQEHVFEIQGNFQDLSALGVEETRVLQTIEESLMEAQAPSVCESSRNQTGAGRSPEDSSRTKDFRERAYDDSREDQKQKGSLTRYGSITSAGSVDRGDPTKKRRVERSRKMAEAKERSCTPPVPSDMQSILKRCENLEKEVRSLKLNLAFMNRKDSEQTKQIEQLEKQNQELAEEKERLLEEIERIVGETGRM